MTRFKMFVSTVLVVFMSMMISVNAFADGAPKVASPDFVSWWWLVLGTAMVLAIAIGLFLLKRWKSQSESDAVD